MCTMPGNFPQSPEARVSLTESSSVTTISRTQILPGACALFTDLRGFSRLAAAADVSDIEDLLEYWDEAHESAAATHGGVIRAVMGDAFFLTFDNPSSLVAAWIELRA